MHSKSVQTIKTFWGLAIAAAAIAAAPAAQAQSIIQLPDSLYTAGDTISWIKKIPTFCEGPVWEPSTGYVYFTRQQLGASTWPIIRVKPGADTGTVWVASPGEANGLDLDPQGRLVAAQRGKFTRYKADGTEDSVLMTSPNNGVTVGLINDLAIGGNGAIYFTTNSTQIYYLSPARQVTLAYSSATSANGIEWDEADSAVYVNEGRQVKKYRVNANGTLSNPQVFITVLAGSGGTYADGGTVDAHGNRYIASYQIGEIRIFNAKGDSIGRIAPKVVTSGFEGFSGAQGNVSNMIFGGADLKTLYFVGDGGLYSIRMKVPGKSRYGVTALRQAAAKADRKTPSAAARDVRGRKRSLDNTLPARANPVLKSR